MTAYRAGHCSQVLSLLLNGQDEFMGQFIGSWMFAVPGDIPEPTMQEACML